MPSRQKNSTKKSPERNLKDEPNQIPQVKTYPVLKSAINPVGNSKILV